MPSAEYSSYINHAISMGLLRTTLHNCVPAAPQTALLPSERPLIKPQTILLEFGEPGVPFFWNHHIQHGHWPAAVKSNNR